MSAAYDHPSPMTPLPRADNSIAEYYAVRDAVRAARSVLNRQKVRALSGSILAERAAVYLRRKGIDVPLEHIAAEGNAQLREAYGGWGAA